MSAAERSQQETAFARLQHIINYLDQAPVGFFSASDEGQVEYMNATLAGWLGLDLVQPSDSNVRLAELARPGTDEVLITTTEEHA